jgi:predicted enzyme related to lactoylglutathione lyase
MSNPVCSFAWYELITPDTAAAAAFYGAVLGWTAQDSGVPGQSYTIFNAASVSVAGMMALPDDMRAGGVPPCWTGYVAVASVDDYVEKVTAAGGRVQRPAEDIPGTGRFAVVADPQGAVFVLFTPIGGMTRPEAAPYSPGHVGWVELHAGEGVSAFAFYSALFGWTKVNAVDMGPMGTYQTFGAGDIPFGGMMTKPDGAPGPCWRYYFTVASVGAAMGRVTAAGGQVVYGPMEVPGDMVVANCMDPQGAGFSLVGSA